YYPGWQEPGSTLEALINKEAFEALPQDLQDVVRHACRVTNADMLAHFTAENNKALQTLVNKHGVQLKELPKDVLNELQKVSNTMIEEQAKTELDQRILQSFKSFRDQAKSWHKVSEVSYYQGRL
ncbi:MAG: ABC transporter substrate-binding protein, partial [Kangiella sp.]|nr:ABC transporter substrate-binding protein [Kangiella sp.]